nr:ribonuclease H-like domain-containing protein [Tanacetum cinerariifolium]
MRGYKLTLTVQGNLDDGKKAVNTACYVQNRVLVVKPQNKTLYEMFHGRTLTLSFMRQFGCLVTILNTLDQSGKFNGSGPDWLFDIDAITRTMNYEPIVAVSRIDWLFDIDALARTINYEPIVVDQKSSHDDGSKPLSDDGKKVDEDPRKESKCNGQKKEDNVSSTNNINIASNVNTVSSTVNVAGTNEVNVVGGKISIELQLDPNMPALKDVSTFDFSRDDEDDDVVTDMNNLDLTIQVSPILTTRILKDHPLDQVIRDLQSATQTRKMSKNLEEHGREAYDKIIQGFETKVKNLANEVEGRVNNGKFKECKTICTKDGSPLYTPFDYSLDEIEYFSSNSGFSDNVKQESNNSGMAEALAALEATLKIRQEEPKADKQSVNYYVDLYEPSIPFPGQLEQHAEEALVHKTMENLNKIKINRPLLKEIRQTDNYTKYMKDLVENKPMNKEDQW